MIRAHPVFIDDINPIVIPSCFEEDNVMSVMHGLQGIRIFCDIIAGIFFVQVIVGKVVVYDLPEFLI